MPVIYIAVATMTPMSKNDYVTGFTVPDSKTQHFIILPSPASYQITTQKVTKSVKN